MKSFFFRTRRAGIRISIVVLMFLITVLSLRPLYFRVTSQINAYITDAQNWLRTSLGVEMSYDSLSPALLFAVRVKNIQIFDAESHERVITVKSASLSYNLFKILTGDVKNALGTLTVRGAAIDADALFTTGALSKTFEYVGAWSASRRALQSSAAPQRGLSLPFNIEIKAALLSSSTLLPADFSVAVRTFSLRKGKSGYFNAAAAGSANVIPDAEVIEKIPAQFKSEVEKISLLFNVSGMLAPDLKQSAISLSLPAINFTSLTFRRLDFLAEYLGNSIRVSQAMNAFPADIMCDILLSQTQPQDQERVRTAVSAVRFRLHADSFEPLALVRNPPRAFTGFLGTRVSGEYELTWMRESSNINYRADGDILFPQSAILGSLNSDFFITGNKEEVTVRRLNFASEKLDASFEGGFKLKNMQTSGQAEITRLQLSNGSEISTEIYFDPLDQGFLCFVPQLNLGELSFAALQLTVVPTADSVDFSFELSDYTHYEFEEPGMFKMEGSLLTQMPMYAQTSVSVENFFVDSILKAISFFMPKLSASRLNAIAGFSAPYILTNEMYVSTDFSSLTYNVPYSIIANTRRDRDFMTFAIDGNNTALRVSRFDLTRLGQSMQSQLQLEISPDYSDFFFTAEMVMNAIPYSFTGTIVPNVMANIAGNYGFSATMFDNGVEGVLGEVTFGNFPVAFSKYILSFSTDLVFSWTPVNGIEASFAALEVSEINNAIAVNPRIMLSGVLNNYGFRMETISYTDDVSQLAGEGSLTWTGNGSVLEGAVFTLAAENSYGGAETCSVMINVSNPELVPFSLGALKNNYYISARANVHEFPMARLFQNQRDNDVVSAEVTALGTFDSPFVTFTIQNASMMLIASPLTLSASAVLDDSMFKISALNARWGVHELQDAAIDVSLENYLAEAKGEYHFIMGERSITAPLDAKFISDGPGANSETSGGFPQSFVLTVSSEGCVSPAFQAPKPFLLTAVRRPGRLDVISGSSSIAGWLLDSGELGLKLGGMLPVAADISGKIAQGNMDIFIDSIAIDVAPFAPFIAFPAFAMYKGRITGDMHLGGVPSDPNFDGELVCTNLEINSPMYVPMHFAAEFFRADITENRLEVANAVLKGVRSRVFRSDDGMVEANLVLELDRWAFDILTVNLVTPENMIVPADTKISRIHVKGDVSCNMDIELRRDAVSVFGAIHGQNGQFEISAMDFSFDSTPAQSAQDTSDVSVNLQMSVGTRMQVLINTTGRDAGTAFRGLVVPGTEVSLLVETYNDTFDLQGDVALRGGEIFYLNRNFYLREGRIVFNEKMGSFDPRITVRAETRDRDTEGEQVKIIMTATNQLLSQFSPVFSSSPAKSETEILSILGQIFSGDAETIGDFSFTLIDWGVQVVVLRRIENGLRELLNFDIFSMRTMILQNVLRSRLDSNQEDKPLTAGSVLDNSTMYVGKYFGSYIYADALLHLSYDENEVLSGKSETGIVFQPEFGLEMMSPYVTIRWNIAPELGKTDFLWVDATSITLSWKFSF
jgi:hypothetical protein